MKLANIDLKHMVSFPIGPVQSAWRNSRRTICYIITIISCTTKVTLVVRLMDANSRRAIENKYGIMWNIVTILLPLFALLKDVSRHLSNKAIWMTTFVCTLARSPSLARSVANHLHRKQISTCISVFIRVRSRINVLIATNLSTRSPIWPITFGPTPARSYSRVNGAKNPLLKRVLWTNIWKSTRKNRFCDNFLYLKPFCAMSFAFLQILFPNA